MEEQFVSFETKTAHINKRELEKALQQQQRVPTLHVLGGAEAGMRVPLTSGPVVIGRAADADLVLTDQQVSRNHAQVFIDPETGCAVLQDLGSTNGCVVNDQPVDRHELEDGDLVLLGGAVLKFVLEEGIETVSREHVDRLLFHDDLTGLVVRRKFFQELQVKIQTALLNGTPLSLLMMDLDGLKTINDTHGHQVGAFVISEVGRIIGGVCRIRGEACRYGGDEFIAYVYGSDKADVKGVGELIRRQIRDHAFEKDGLELKVSISIGVATLQPGQTVQELTQAADEALYRAKAKGRDYVSD